MKVTLSPEYPNFYFQHRGVKCQLTLSGWEHFDRHGNSQFAIYYTHDFYGKSMCGQITIKPEKTYKFGEKFLEPFVQKWYGDFLFTQEQLIAIAVNGVTRWVNRLVDEEEKHLEAFNAITKLEYDIPE